MDGNVTARDRRLLKDLLTVLITRWGYATVRRQLDGIGEQNDLSQQHGKKIKQNKRRSAYEYVSKREDLSSSQRGLLLEIGLRFDHKRFLPSIADVRSFLYAKDVRDGRYVARDAAIPVVFQKLLTLSDEQLRAILDDQNYAGPARLGPLSAAIKASGGRS
ncbi:MAG TPA: hypothetical protein VGR45_03155 [Stellaceae bacterium]|nr:hypothetical protein [Stellaceae bacterium]HEV2300181.1 hypothetical protein [Stellaceae bacterium]